MAQSDHSISLLEYPTRRLAHRLTPLYRQQPADQQIAYPARRLVDGLIYLIYGASPNNTGRPTWRFANQAYARTVGLPINSRSDGSA